MATGDSGHGARRLFVTDAKTKINFLIDTGADLCIPGGWSGGHDGDQPTNSLPRTVRQFLLMERRHWSWILEYDERFRGGS